MTKKIRVKSKRLIIEPMSVEELSALIDSTSDGDLKQAYGEMLSGVKGDPGNAQWYTYWKITQKSNGTSIGGVCFKGTPNSRHEVEVGYGIDEPYRQKGYATEALNAMSDWAFFQRNAYYIRAEADDGNAASKRVLEKCNFKPVEGGDGQLFEREKNASAWLPAYICIGLSIGLSMGTLLNNIAIGLCFGMAFGLSIGALLDAADKKLRKRE